MTIWVRVDQIEGWEHNEELHCPEPFDLMQGQEHHVLRHEWGSGVMYIPIKGNPLAVQQQTAQLIPQAFLHCIHCKSVSPMSAQIVNVGPEQSGATLESVN